MRKLLNNNPLVAVAIIGVLGVGVAFLLLSSLSSSSSSSGTETTTDPAATTSSVPGATDTTAVPAPTSTSATPSAATATGAVAPATGVPPASGAVPAAPGAVGAFVAGPGLPKAVVAAYKSGDAVALLVVKRDGIDDRAVRKGFRQVSAMHGVTAFETLAEGVARYSRLTEGVDLDRVPALVVLRPRSVTGSGPPRATVIYGFNSPQQLTQAVRDAIYKGPEDLPYHPR